MQKHPRASPAKDFPQARRTRIAPQTISVQFNQHKFCKNNAGATCWVQARQIRFTNASKKRTPSFE